MSDLHRRSSVKVRNLLNKMAKWRSRAQSDACSQGLGDGPQVIQNKDVSEEMKGAQSLSKSKVPGMWPTFFPKTTSRKNLTCLCNWSPPGHQETQALDKAGGWCIPEHQMIWTFVFLKQYMRGAPLHEILSRFIPSEHCLICWLHARSGSSSGSLWPRMWAGVKDFFWARRWFCTRGSEFESSARDSNKSLGGGEIQDANLGQWSNYDWKGFWVGWDGARGVLDWVTCYL